MPSDQATPRRALVLFCGTGSIDRAFQRLGWQVVSVDACAKYAPTHVADVHKWDHAQYPPGHFDFCWGSPPCTQFSRSRTNPKAPPRDLAGACATVACTLQIFAYFGCPWALENPSTGLLKRQAVVQDLPWRDVTYCKYGTLWRKGTRIWNTLGDAWQPLAPCCKAFPCAHFAALRRHPMTAEVQRRKGRGRAPCPTHTDQVYAIPDALCDEIAAAAQRVVDQEAADG